MESLIALGLLLALAFPIASIVSLVLSSSARGRLRAIESRLAAVESGINGSAVIRGLESRLTALETAMRGAAGTTANALASQGFVVEPLRLQGLERAIELWWFFFGPAIAHLFQPTVAGHQDKLSRIFREYLQFAEAPVTLDALLSACAERDLLRANILRQLRDVPILLSPVSTTTAFRHGEGTWRPGAQQCYRDTMRFSQWLNLTGFPGASVPVSVSADGLPIGVQVIGRPHEEELVLAVAERIERGRGPWQAPPE